MVVSYLDFSSNIGALTNEMVLKLELRLKAFASPPEILKDIASPSSSDTSIVPITVSLSTTDYSVEPNTGDISLTLVTLTVIFWEVSFNPSFAVTIAV